MGQSRSSEGKSGNGHGLDMIETGISEIDVNELMEKIRVEIRKRSAHKYVGDRRNSGFSHGGARNSWLSAMQSEPFEEKQDGYYMNDFLQHHDKEFVINAYRGILGRPADAGGDSYFLEALQSGKMTKAEILGRLRYSPEGRARKTKVRGLLPSFCIQSLFKIPVLGYFCRLIVSIFNLPTIVRNLQIIEASSAAQWQRQKNGLREWTDMVEKEIDEVVEHQRALRSSLEQRVEEMELETLKEETPHEHEDDPAKIGEREGRKVERNKFA